MQEDLIFFKHFYVIVLFEIFYVLKKSFNGKHGPGVPVCEECVLTMGGRDKAV